MPWYIWINDVCIAGADRSAADTRFLWLAAALALLSVVVGFSHFHLANLASLLSFGTLMYFLTSVRQARVSEPAGGVQCVKETGQSWTVTLIKAEFTQGSWSGESHSTDKDSGCLSTRTFAYK